jgi:hypothetical protein
METLKKILEWLGETHGTFKAAPIPNWFGILCIFSILCVLFKEIASHFLSKKKNKNKDKKSNVSLSNKEK